MKYTSFILAVMVVLCSCSNSNNKNVNEEPEYLSEEDYNIQFDTATRKFMFNRYSVFENSINRCIVEREFFELLTSKLKTLMWRPGRILINSLDTALDKRDMMLMDDNAHYFEFRTYNNNYTAKIQMWDSVKIHGEMIGFLYREIGSDSGLDDPTFIAFVDSIKIIRRK